MAKAAKKKPVKGKGKAAAAPDWLRKAMTKPVTPSKPKGRPPGSKNKPKIEPQTLKRGKKPMAMKPHYDPLDDPDLRADAKGDVPIVDPKPPGGYDKPGNQLPGAPDNTLPGAGGKPDQSLPEHPTKPGKPAPLPGGGVRPDNALPEPEEPASFDEVQSGAVIPDENMQALIAGTMGGGGDHHAMAKRIVERMKEAKWVTHKAADEGNIDALSAKGRKPNASIKPDERKDDERKDDKR
jgi:hypothetical protein